MKINKLLKHKFVSEFIDHLDDEFEKTLFVAALRNYCSHGNPIRFNNFAFAMRELLQHVLDRKAPEDKVCNCVWFSPDPKNNNKPTRRQQLKYCMQAGLQDNLLSDEIKSDMEILINNYNSHVSDLNSYTHISKKTFGQASKKSYEQLKAVLTTFNSAMGIIEEGKKEVVAYVPEKLGDYLEAEVRVEIPAALDEISTHTYVEDVELVGFSVSEIDHEYIYIEGESTAYVTLNYGSSSDFKRGDGVSLNDNFPVLFKCKAKANNPKRAFVVKGSIKAVNDSWYQ